jgi:GNAT superfamily N-acetyltransferase
LSSPASDRIELRPEDPDSADARWCLSRYFEELAARFEAGFDPGRGGMAADREMAPPTGLFLVAHLAGDPVGCAGLKLHAGQVAEVKRMWVAPAARGLGLARRMLRELEIYAKGAGARTLRLDTNGVLKEAQALYRSEGFAEVPRYNDNPYAQHWFEKAL